MPEQNFDFSQPLAGSNSFNVTHGTGADPSESGFGGMPAAPEREDVRALVSAIRKAVPPSFTPEPHMVGLFPVDSRVRPGRAGSDLVARLDLRVAALSRFVDVLIELAPATPPDVICVVKAPLAAPVVELRPGMRPEKMTELLGRLVEQASRLKAPDMLDVQWRVERQPPLTPADSMPVSIYLENENASNEVNRAVEKWLDGAGLKVERWWDPVLGSWFQRMHATAKQAVHSGVAQDAALTALHAADSRLVLYQDAQTTSFLLQNLGPVLTALQPTKDAVIRAGALLILKIDWRVQVFQLTAAQQAVLDHRPQLAMAPHEILGALQLDRSEAVPVS
jgi:hypothetical protein